MTNKYDPVFNSLGFERLQNELGRIFDPDNINFDEIFRSGSAADAAAGREQQWRPKADVWETAEKFVIEADIPGVDPDNIELSVQRGSLTISGFRDASNGSVAGVASDEEDIARQRHERRSGRFYRKFDLPDSADLTSVNASGKHGVLVIEVTKDADTDVRKIKVSQG